MDILEIRERLENHDKMEYIEFFNNVEELLEEYSLTEDEFIDRVNDVGFKVEYNTPIVLFDSPLSTLFNVCYITKGMDTDEVIEKVYE